MAKNNPELPYEVVITFYDNSKHVGTIHATDQEQADFLAKGEALRISEQINRRIRVICTKLQISEEALP